MLLARLLPKYKSVSYYQSIITSRARNNITTTPTGNHVAARIAKDEVLGRRYVDEAASDGLEIAKRLQGAGYDLDEVTPDADNRKYAPLF